MDGPLAKPITRAARFAVGFILGLLAVPAAVVGLGLVVIAGLAALGSGQVAGKPFLLTSSGADISRAGGAAMIVQRGSDTTRLDCRDGCDDLRIEDEDGGLEAIRVFGGNGDCVVCRTPGDFQGPGNSWSVSGHPRLKVAQALAHD